MPYLPPPSRPHICHRLFLSFVHLPAPPTLNVGPWSAGIAPCSHHRASDHISQLEMASALSKCSRKITGGLLRDLSQCPHTFNVPQLWTSQVQHRSQQLQGGVRAEPLQLPEATGLMPSSQPVGAPYLSDWNPFLRPSIKHDLSPESKGQATVWKGATILPATETPTEPPRSLLMSRSGHRSSHASYLLSKGPELGRAGDKKVTE
jgi:hypothetical protein